MEAGERSEELVLALAELGDNAGRFGVELSAEQLSSFESYLKTLMFWRTRLSLTGTATATAIVRRHVLDSLALMPEVRPGSSIADLGSGAGFPGIPLAIACRRCSVDLVESRRKRANFLREVARCAALGNVTVREARVEDLGSQYAGRYDLVASRAVWRVGNFLEASRSLLRSGGVAIAMKSRKLSGQSLSHPGFAAAKVRAYHLPEGIERILLLYTKI